jgi:hypothetical protein
MSGSKRPPRAKTLPRNFIRSQFSPIRKKVIQENSALYRSTDGGNDKTGTLNGQQKKLLPPSKSWLYCLYDGHDGRLLKPDIIGAF